MYARAPRVYVYICVYRRTRRSPYVRINGRNKKKEERDDDGKEEKKTPAKRMIYRFRLKGRTGMTGAIAGTRSNKFQKGFFFPNVNARYRTIIEYVISQQRLPSDDSASSETVFRFVDVSFHTVPKLDVLETSCTDGKAIACCIYLSLTKIEKEKRTNLKREKKKQNKKTCIVERDADACRAIITSESLEVLQFFSFFI